MRRTIILNGPPRSGKDTIAKMIANTYKYEHCEFKKALFIETVKQFDVTMDWFMDGYDDNKEEPAVELQGYSKRNALIYTSENIIKKKYGNDYFGLKAAEQIQDKTKVVFSDGGFDSEIYPVLALDPELFLIKIYRDGYTYDNDSRNYITPGIVKNEFVIFNNGGIKELSWSVVHLMEKIEKGI